MRKKSLYPLLTLVTVFILHAVYSILKIAQVSKQWVQIEDKTPLAGYLEQQDYFLGLSYALASAFTVYAVLNFLQDRKSGVPGAIGGFTLTGILYFGGCFLLGCCGSPMLAVYLNLFGASFLGLTKQITLLLTAASVAFGYFWVKKRSKTAKSCCSGDKKCSVTSDINEKDFIR